MATTHLGIRNALPFWLSVGIFPVTAWAETQGGFWVVATPIYAWVLFTLLDRITGLNLENADPDAEENRVFWYRAVTLVWFPLQFALIFGSIYYMTRADHLGLVEKICLTFGIGVSSGTIGIVYSHELMHQRNRIERWLADLLLASVLYSHFRSEHLLVHHKHVGTPRDAVTARYNEGFHRFFPRVLRESPKSAWEAETAMLARRGLPPIHPRNPFFRYAALQAGFLILALLLGGIGGLAIFLYQAFIAIWQLELTNYIEHYGLTRRHLGDGKYEHVKPHHSWNASHRATNWLLINLQRHSDHHAKPDRRFPLLQTYLEHEAPQLPHGYPLMAVFAMVPRVWRRKMNPRVRKWRDQFYPDIDDWEPYKRATNPLPRL